MLLFLRLIAPLAAALAVAVPPEQSVAPADHSAAAAAFRRLTALAGEWEGTSTKGWKERIRFRVIARGTAVLETSFDAHPGETMATVFALDRGRLDLRHYCVSGTHPHLEATRFEEDGRRVTFTYVDGGNLPSRDTGHMDRVVLLFEDDDHVRSRWTWYRDGKESWLEEIRLARVRAGVRGPAPSGP
jgi:hypothetical protein